MRALVVGAALAALGSGAAAETCNQQVVADFVDLFYNQRKVAEAFETHVAPDYIQHNLAVGQGRDKAIAFLTPMFSRANFSADPVRVSIDGDLASVLLKITIYGQVKAAVLDLYRLDGCKIVEHWDIKDEIDPSDKDAYFTHLEAAK